MLGKEIRDLENAGIDIFHFDICDGLFAPTFLWSPSFIKALRSETLKYFEAHLYVSR